uniref:Uncharacterized protein n=1 Tax=Anguilla anguilla TaxID=7936 RepID=A0A0E9QLC4_ANGAN
MFLITPHINVGTQHYSNVGFFKTQRMVKEGLSGSQSLWPQHKSGVRSVAPCFFSLLS